MALNIEEEKTLLLEIEALKELPIERIKGVIGGQDPQEVSVLYRICEKVEISQEGLEVARQIVNQLSEILKRYREITGTGRALVANQIGINKAVVIFLDEEGQVSTYINPEITWKSKRKNIYSEICISGSPLCVDVVRPERIKVKWFDLEGKPHEGLMDGLNARRMQHEIDHLDGKVCYNTQGTIYSTLGYALDPQVYRNQTLRIFGEGR